MGTLKAHFGTSSQAKLGKDWTFKMDEGFKVSAGRFSIIPEDQYLELLVAAKGMRNSMRVHPECEEDSEFECMVNRMDEALSNVE